MSTTRKIIEVGQQEHGPARSALVRQALADLEKHRRERERFRAFFILSRPVKA